MAIVSLFYSIIAFAIYGIPFVRYALEGRVYYGYRVFIDEPDPWRTQNYPLLGLLLPFTILGIGALLMLRASKEGKKRKSGRISYISIRIACFSSLCLLIVFSIMRNAADALPEYAAWNDAAAVTFVATGVQYHIYEYGKYSLRYF